MTAVDADRRGGAATVSSDHARRPASRSVHTNDSRETPC
jgi:hypothetical protein